MPAGYGKTCEECHWRDVFSRHRTLNLALFSHPTIAGEYDAFCHWLGNTAPYRHCGRYADRYCIPFLKVGLTTEQDVNWAALYRTLSPGELRKFPLLEKWLRGKDATLPLTSAKQESAEDHYIRNILARSEKMNLSQYVRQYALHLEQKRSTGTGLRTIRMALSAAVGFLESIPDSHKREPVQRDVNRYLRCKPGQRASLWNFIIFLNVTYSAALLMPKKNSDRTQQRKRLERRLCEMLDGRENFSESLWLKYALACFHHITVKKAGCLLRRGSLDYSDEGASLHVDGKVLWIPLPANMQSILTGKPAMKPPGSDT
ncbi:hypothetical protein ACIMOF_04135 [Escherichia coli]